jgi:hypothetical protein
VIDKNILEISLKDVMLDQSKCSHQNRSGKSKKNKGKVEISTVPTESVTVHLPNIAKSTRLMYKRTEQFALKMYEDEVLIETPISALCVGG